VRLPLSGRERNPATTVIHAAPRSARPAFVAAGRGKIASMDISFLLWLIAVVLVIWGIITIVRGGLLMGIVLIVLGLLIGPGGVSIFNV
jgi:hypothetical protein